MDSPEHGPVASLCCGRPYRRAPIDDSFWRQLGRCLCPLQVAGCWQGRSWRVQVKPHLLLSLPCLNSFELIMPCVFSHFNGERRSQNFWMDLSAE